MDNRPDAIFFDLDGTLLGPSDSTLERDWRAACEACCDGAFDVDAVLPHLHNHRVEFWKDAERARRGRFDLNWARETIVRDAFVKAGINDDSRTARIAVDYRERREAAMLLFPSAIATLERARAMGIRTALITNGAAEMQRDKVVRFELAPYFDCIVIEGEFGFGKPDERVFRHALAAVGAAPERTWMVGDYIEADIETPVRLGMHAVWVDGAGTGLPPDATVRPHRIVRTIAELL